MRAITSMVALTAALGIPEDLLFLKDADNGRFEPVSGEIDPRLSVKEIYSPLPGVIDGRLNR